MKPRFRSWRGGKCPVKNGTKTERIYRDGVVQKVTAFDSPAWLHFGEAGDIIAYRVLEQEK